MINLLLLLAALGIVLGLRGARAGRRGGVLLLAAAGALALGLAVHRFRAGDANLRAVVSTATTYGEAMGRKLARETALRHPGARVLVLLPPGSATVDHAIADGFREEAAGLALAAETATLAAPAAVRAQLEQHLGALPPPERAAAVAQELDDYSRWLTADTLASLLRDWSGRADLVLYLPSLPTDLASRSALFQGGPRLLVAHVDAEQVDALLASGLADAAVLVNPASDLWHLPAHAPADVDKAFAQRYLLVTAGQSVSNAP